MTEFNLNNVPLQKGRISIVTGANTGLGYEISKALAGTGMKVILACRSMEKAREAKNRILKIHPRSDLVTMLVDLSKFSSVRSFARDYLDRYNRLDLLINNAGIMMPPYSKTEDGLESQMGVNYFAHFLLTGLLFGTITKTTGSRIVSLASNAHRRGRIHFEDINWEKDYSRLQAYGQSKLACLIFALELDRRIKKAGIKALSIAAHPGVSITDLVRYIPKWVLTLGRPFTALFTHSPEQGALPVLYAALADDVRGGEYFGPQGSGERTGKPGRAKSEPHAHDEAAAQKLWDLSEKITGVSFP